MCRLPGWRKVLQPCRCGVLGQSALHLQAFEYERQVCDSLLSGTFWLNRMLVCQVIRMVWRANIDKSAEQRCRYPKLMNDHKRTAVASDCRPARGRLFAPACAYCPSPPVRLSRMYTAYPQHVRLSAPVYRLFAFNLRLSAPRFRQSSLMADLLPDHRTTFSELAPLLSGPHPHVTGVLTLRRRTVQLSPEIHRKWAPASPHLSVRSPGCQRYVYSKYPAHLPSSVRRVSSRSHSVCSGWRLTPNDIPRHPRSRVATSSPPTERHQTSVPVVHRPVTAP